MTSCFEVAMDLNEAGFLKGDDIETATTVLVQTLIAMGIIKERTEAVQRKAVEEEIYGAAEQEAAANDARADFEQEIRNAEIMFEAQERKTQHEKTIAEAEVVIDENVHTATAALVDHGLINPSNADAVTRIIARSWASIDS
ncbi:MAG: hypothetical protein ACK2UK_21385 [Candidatus Promineifilaceae bacterium]